MQLKEKDFEESILENLCTAGGYVLGDTKNFDKHLAIDAATLLKFVKSTQAKEFEKLASRVADVENYFIKNLCAQLDEKNYTILDALRDGVEIRGCKFKLVYWKPETNLNSETVELYAQNILTCVRQLHYSAKNNNSLDIVLFVNGLPLVTMELKNQFTGQNVEDAINQYKNDRDPHEKIFQFGKRALVHFAVDLYEVFMTTKLDGKETVFIPFNQGSNGAGKVGGAGNPSGTNYLWEKVLCKDTFLEILQKYLLFDKKETKIIFPRYHQLDAVTKILAHVKANGAGHNYLIQHSAGSGKSNSIAWLAHQLSGLHDANNEIIFNSVIVVTDRKILDSQLQNTVYQFERTAGIVEKIDKNAAQLREAINGGKKIIITTLQKFPFIFKEVKSDNKKFAVIVDEAHSSQTGDSAQKLKISLTDTAARLAEFAKLESAEEIKRSAAEEKMLEELAAHGKQPNLSFFAFTATPKNKTLQIFGEKNSAGEYAPFHIYSMRQAVEEGFILDVPANYVTYKMYFQIGKKTADNPEVYKGKATAAIKNFEMLHPHNIAEKTKIIIEHFNRVTKNKIGGNAKAMLVTSSRLHAVKFFFAVKDYIAKNKISDVKPLIAFSGEVEDDGKTYTEQKLNGVKENALPKEFQGRKYNFLIVAEKYQTGFDEPLLHTMFVDKKLDGVKAVQTLSRLNRTAKGKNDTFILDFVNSAEDIKAAFQPFYEGSILSEGTDFNTLYKMKRQLDDYKIYSESDIDAVTNFFYQAEKFDAQIINLLQPPCDKFRAIADENRRETFKTLLARFDRLYSFLIQVCRSFDIELQKFYIFAHLLYKILPRRESPAVEIAEILTLEYYTLKKIFSGNINLDTAKNEKIVPVTGGDGTSKVDTKNPLTKIIQEINIKFGTNFTDKEKVLEKIVDAFKNDKKAVNCAKENDSHMFRKAYNYDKKFDEVCLDCISQDEELSNFIAENMEILETFKESLFDYIYTSFNPRTPNGVRPGFEVEGDTDIYFISIHAPQTECDMFWQ